MTGPEPPTRASWLELSLIPLVTGVVLLTVPNLINQNRTIDPFVYTGFIHSYHELLTRFGRTYYSTRIAFIDPARALLFLFGESAGYVLLRFVALAAALGSLWAIAHRYYGARVAGFCLVLFALQPVLVRSLLWDHIDGFATTYLLAGAVCLIGISSNPGPVLCAAAGACLALATNCYPLTVVVGALFLPAWLVLQPSGTSMRRRVVRVAIAGAGFLSVAVLLALVLYVELPTGSPFYDSTSVGIALRLLGGGAAEWFHPWSALSPASRLLVLTPPFLAVMLVVVCLASGGRRGLAQPSLCIAALLYFAGVYAFCVTMDVGFKVGVFSYFYLQTYLFPATAFCVICAVGECATRVGTTAGILLAGAAGLSVAAWLLIRWAVDLVAGVPLWIIGAVGALALIAVLMSRRAPRIALAAVLAACIAWPITAYRSGGEYLRLHVRRYRPPEIATYHAAVHLIRIIGDLPDRDKSLVFWYPEKGGGRTVMSLDSVQSVYLWGYSRLPNVGFDEDHEPRLDASSRMRVLGTARIVLMGYRQSDIDRMRRALDDAGIVTRSIRSDRFEESGLLCFTLVLDRL
ncbi:MAG TPA: hypothetical protein VF921_10040 [Vicinamibacterales bacterium]